MSSSHIFRHISKFEYEKNDPVLYGKYIVGENDEDMSPEIPEPKYIPEFYFIHGPAPIPHESKYFGKLKQSKITISCAVVWKYSHMFDVYKL